MRAKLIFLILDVHYQTDVVQKLDSAKVAGIRFQGIETNEILSEHTVNVNNVIKIPFATQKQETFHILMNLNQDITTQIPFLYKMQI